MRITSKGQVTIPQEIRNCLGLLPHPGVELELAGDHVRNRKAQRQHGEDTKGRLAGTSHRLAEDASSQANHSGGWLHFAKTEK